MTKYRSNKGRGPIWPLRAQTTALGATRRTKLQSKNGDQCIFKGNMLG